VSLHTLVYTNSVYIHAISFVQHFTPNIPVDRKAQMLRWESWELLLTQEKKRGKREK